MSEPIAVMLEVDTRRFNFKTFGKNQAEALELLHKAWEKHCEQYGADPDYFTEYDTDGAPWDPSDYGISFTEIQLGMAMRDNEPLLH